MSFHTLKTVDVKCSLCHLRSVCIPTRLVESEFVQLEHVIKKRVLLKRGQNLINGGDKFDALYAVSSGSFKNVNISNDGTQQITNFFLPGELIGLNAIYNEHHVSHTVALETSSVCRINFEQLEDIMSTLPNLRKEVLSLMSREIRQEQRAIGIISHRGAIQRVVSFILNLSARYRKNGMSANAFILPMTRSDIGDYLGLVTETVSRQLSLLVDMNAIKVEGRSLTILDMPSLAEIVRNED